MNQQFKPDSFKRHTGPAFPQTDWNKFVGVDQRHGNERDSTRFVLKERTKTDSYGLIYDPFLPTIPVDVTLHCVVCKSFCRGTLHVMPDAKRPQPIVGYRCKRCNGRTWREQDLVEKHPGAYGSWRAMRARCYCKGHSSYANYGGRGITICPRWFNYIDGFGNFVHDMVTSKGLDDRPEGLSIDRIDVNGNYGPDNCRWASALEQAANKRCSMANELMDDEVYSESERLGY